ncbi:enoyl-CoA hydratase/isomerase family protein [Cupriavidus oxalaticus]|jgi:enoyl-CoA hydratase/carnithine racemase|uniref:Enoyl-CoA hydratase/isomerase n=1 Tax=Cupriavidus oxalaticus TaxID=96344 RepID=A0A375FZF7_9BURK|nr:enoyl-CoA hydratase/isomerase family protein [Cupriavidus oxalaticus]QEZ46617.1 enoyl-CoA hydratase/isomerase family protein [Cupriavidus oxalaticus]QRQ89062.1 enoyl-CoA hydratase/isomerase family protein [Cupriavidus oxalaticus]QRQ95863.1 enoyl-CoA hydratase/isomerase family protein [Cupriavidus oxalaticus]WQD84540.1 enoyl-CoA hydratase/isomerase family protein [Cupriavidus oxalaticus]SPC06530.1 Enoyl-CoA hydratase/isomerase [Cupriavidus oxalaticus]
MEIFTTLTLELRDGIAIVTLNDAPRRNALSRCMVGELFAAIDQSRALGARALVIAANGPTFCAGANIDDLRDGWMERADPRTDPALLFRRLVEDDRVVVAAVQGPAVGGGFELTLSCDLVIAEEGAWFALPEVTRGVIPNTGLALLPRVVGTRQALQLVLTARRVSAVEALQRGLVNEVVGKGTSLERAIALARAIVGSAPPGALIAAKRHLHAHAGPDWKRVVNSVTDVPRAEWQEGLDAFTEKRKTDFEPLWQDHQCRMGRVEQSS